MESKQNYGKDPSMDAIQNGAHERSRVSEPHMGRYRVGGIDSTFRQAV